MTTKIDFKYLLNVAKNVNDLHLVQSKMQSIIDIAPEKAKTKGTYQNCAKKILRMLKTDFQYIPFNVFMEKGNSKLKFIAFSSLPIVDCFGAGDCVNYCYSLKAWRNPNAFFRQLQNSLLLRHSRNVVSRALHQLPENKTVRLYVDGDFYSMSCLKFWFQMMRLRSDLKFYGYSKSLHLFSAYKGAFPPNYVLNKSNGSKFDDNKKIQSKIESLPIYRGNFLAKKEVDNKKDFVCPGKCFDCLPNGKHACGVAKLKKDIVIQIH